MALLVERTRSKEEGGGRGTDLGTGLFEAKHGAKLLHELSERFKIPGTTTEDEGVNNVSQPHKPLTEAAGMGPMGGGGSTCHRRRRPGCPS